MRNVDKIASKAKCLGDDILNVCKDVLEDERFANWSGSSKPHQHHYGKGGLATHTLEVINTCFRVKSLYEHTYEFDSKEVFLAAFFHDVGKMYDYEPVGGSGRENGGFDRYELWQSTPHKRLIHHISRSGIMWSENAKKDKNIYDKYFENVLHAILSHHTAREYGSPVAPKTRTAWLLTLCDNISARMYDADSWDCIGGQ